MRHRRLIGAGVLCVVAIAASLRRDRQVEICTECNSTQVHSQYLLRLWRCRIVLRDDKVVVASHVLGETWFPSAGHRHRWMHRHGKDDYVLLPIQTRSQGAYRNRFADLYETSPEFRRQVARAVQRTEMTWADVLTILGFTRYRGKATGHLQAASSGPEVVEIANGLLSRFDMSE